MLVGCDWWFSIRSVDNTQDWWKFWKRFRGCFVFQSLISTKTVTFILFLRRISIDFMQMACFSSLGLPCIHRWKLMTEMYILFQAGESEAIGMKMLPWGWGHWLLFSSSSVQCLRLSQVGECGDLLWVVHYKSILLPLYGPIINKPRTEIQWQSWFHRRNINDTMSFC